MATMQVIPRKKETVLSVERKNNALFLTHETGIIRIWPQTDSNIRVSRTEKECFSNSQGEEFADLSGECRWDWEQNDDQILLLTNSLNVRISCATGSVCMEAKDGRRLMCEREHESKTLEAFDFYRIVPSESMQVEVVQTADGVKHKIRSADKIFDRQLFHTRLNLVFSEEEKLFGLGQAEEGVWNLRGTTQYLHQANLKIAVPLLLSDRGYGILLSTQSPAIFSDTQYGSYMYTEADEYLDYYFLAGSFSEIVYGMRQLTGRAVMLPKWAFGYMQSKERYENARELIDTTRRFREEKIGMDAVILDWMSWEEGKWGQKSFDLTRFPDPAAMVEKLHELDTHFMMSIWPNMDESCQDYQEFAGKGLLLPGSNIYNAFSEEGRSLYWQQVQHALFQKGVDAWWCDSSEAVTPEWLRVKKPEPSEMYFRFVEAASNCMPVDKANAYGLYHAQGIYEGQRSVSSEKRVCNLTRSGYPGGQKYGTILWSGDISASWETLRRQIPEGLQFCACGLPYWTLDIGAFYVKRGETWCWNGEYEHALADLGYQELYVRWLQYAAFLPIFRSHGTDCPREPWQFGKKGDPFYDAIVSAITQRYRLMPYIYSLAGSVWREHGTMIRMLAFDFQNDQKAVDISDQYMFGPSLLVCPVTEPMYYGTGNVSLDNAVKERRVYLPEGSQWYDFRTDECYIGGQEIMAAADISSIPVFVRAGSIVPVTEQKGSIAAQEGCPVTLLIYPGADGNFTLYEDAGDGYGYEKGEYSLTYIRYQDKDRSVEWETKGKKEFRKGQFSVAIVGDM